MHRRFPHIVLLIAWLLATGTHWDLVQVVAWGKMYASNAQTMSTREALLRTFDGREFCGMCLVVQEAKHDGDAEQAPAGRVDAKSPILLPTAVELILGDPPGVTLIPGDCAWPENEREAPPAPPPRARRV